MIKHIKAASGLTQCMDMQLSRIGLLLIFCYCLVASIFYAGFAQLSVHLFFLPFPVFIGEILLLICLILFLIIGKTSSLPFTYRGSVLLGLYFGWVIGKAAINFYFDGPLTVRNAALFYYPAFAVLTYCFYQKAKISSRVYKSLALIAAFIISFQAEVFYYWWTYLLLLVTAIYHIKSVKIRWLGWIFIISLIVFRTQYLYEGSRTHFVSVFGSAFFLLIYFILIMFRRRNYLAVNGIAISFILFVLGFFVLANRNDVHSVLSLREMVKTYKVFDQGYHASQSKYVPPKLTVQLYHQKNFELSSLKPAASTGASLATTEKVDVPWYRIEEIVMKPKVDSSCSLKENLIICHLQKLMSPNEAILHDCSFALDENNIVFRLFVWRDMISEFVQTPSAWAMGFSFGHPQRSKSLETLHWAESEWSRDGWITPHNSFLHVIYRAGILGILLIGILFFRVGKLIKDFYIKESVEGGLLVGILVYWMVLSNFLVILEFPYNAILFWAIFGIAWAYRRQLYA